MDKGKLANKKVKDTLLAFYHAQTSQTLLAVINNFVLEACGDMPVNSIERYELYYYSGAFYNMVIHWLEDGARESPEDMAEDFLRIVRGQGSMQPAAHGTLLSEASFCETVYRFLSRVAY